MIWIGLFSASLTRPTGIFLLPAFLAMVMLCKDQEKKWTGIFKVYCIDYGLPILAGTALFVWYQHHAIGIWFAYFIQQRKYEGHAFAMTILPFASYEGPRILWISALAMLCCFLSLVVIILKLYKRFFKKAIEPDRLLIVSLVYFIITLYKTAFYNPIWGAGTTLTIGISRYVFATPFFFVFLNHFTNRERSYKPIHFLLMFLLCNIVWLSCGSYKHILTTLYFNFLTLIVFAYMLLPDKKYQWPAMAIMGVNVVLQVLSFQHYLANYYLD